MDIDQAIQHVSARLEKLEWCYVRDFPKWTAGDRMAVSILLSEYLRLVQHKERFMANFDKAIELLKEFAFYCVDDTLEEHAQRAYKVQEFLLTTPAKEWVEKQRRLIKCAYCDTFEECEKQDGTCDA